MAYKDIRQFGDPVTEVLRYSDAPLNVNFHLRWVCVRTRYPNFSYTWLDLPLQMQQSLSPLHFQRLLPISAIFETSFNIRIFFCLLSFHDHFYFSVKFFGFWDVFDVSCIIILGNWFAKFFLVMASLNDLFKGEFTDS